jgi:GT2 family glycosyltransferase
VKTSHSLFVVLVLYGTPVAESVTVRSLLEQETLPPDLLERVLLFDNSPSDQSCPLGESWQYHHAGSNLGLAGAYNFALSEARRIGCDWLLLLDQDTTLPPDFLRRLSAHLAAIQDDQSIVACVPEVWTRNKLISPWERKLSWNIPLRERGKLVPKGIAAVNSGSCVRTSFLTGIGGLDERFWLDYLDHWMYMMIERSGRSIFIADQRIEHNLSVHDYDGAVSFERYRNILDAESLFAREYLGLFERLALIVRLPLRALWQLAKVRDKRIARATLNLFLKKAGGGGR